MERKQVSVPSGTISYLHRSGDHPVIFLHGLGGTGNSWIKIAKYLRSDLELFFPDLPGHGRSMKNQTDFTVQRQADIMAEFINTLGIERFSLVGNSYGGWISIRYTTGISQPANLILVDSAGKNPTIGEKEEKAYSAFVDRVMSMSEFNERHIIEGILKNNSREEEKATAEELGQITCRTAIIWGTEDSMIPLKYGKELHESIPGSTLYMMTGTGHLPQIEDPQGLARIINSFIQ